MKFTITKNSNYEIKTKSGKFSINGNSATNGIKQLAAGDVIEISDSDNDLKSVEEVPTTRYTRPIEPKDDNNIYTIEEWKETVHGGGITNYDGSGYWVKDGFKSRDEVFSTPQLDATHVVWYNK